MNLELVEEEEVPQGKDNTVSGVRTICTYACVCTCMYMYVHVCVMI